MCRYVAPVSDLSQEVWVSRIRVDGPINEEEGVSVTLVQSGATSRQIAQEVEDRFVYGHRSWGCCGKAAKRAVAKVERRIVT